MVRDMKTVKRLRLFVLSAAMLIGMLAFSTQAYAIHTRVGQPASHSYVKKSFTGRVLIFAGDSRTMYLTADNLKAQRNNCAFVFENGGSIKSIANGGELKPYLDTMIQRYRGRCVVIMNFGINGNSNPKGNAKRITRVYRRWMRRYPDVTFLVESVNPSGHPNGGVGNPKIEKLNRFLKKEFGSSYIDVSTYLLNRGIVDRSGKGTKDNLHYKRRANRAIYRYVKNFVSSYAF